MPIPAGIAPAPTPEEADGDHVARKALRLTRFMMAAGSSVAICTLLGVLYLYDAIGPWVLLSGSALILGSVVVFYLVFRTGLNRFARDPSLTGPMTVASVSCLLYVMSLSAIVRETFPIFFGLVLLFGVFRFSTRSLLFQVALMLAGYGGVIALGWQRAPEAARPVADLSSWLTVATVLPLFAVIGGQIMRGRRAAVQKLSASEERFRRLTALSSDWYWEQDPQMRFITVSPGIAAKAGVAPQRMLRRSLRDLAVDPDDAVFSAFAYAVQSHERFTDLQCRVRDDTGATRWLSVNGEPLFDATGYCTGYYGTGRDVTALKEAEALVHFQAHHDALTGLPNRMLFDDRLEQAIAQATRTGAVLWVLFVDLDRFKLINDSLGHKVGDIVLKRVAQRMHALLRKGDTVARLGGDEFVLLLTDPPPTEQAATVVERLIACVRTPVQIEEHALQVGCSIGIAVYPADGAHADVLVERADVAMYRAKATRRGEYCFYTPDMTAQAAADRRGQAPACA